MSRFEEPRIVLAGSLRSGRLWLLQFLLNPILAGLFAAWLLIPEAKLWQLAFNVFLAIVIVAAALLLHAGTLNYFSDEFREEPASIKTAFGRALRHVAAIAVCAIVLCLVWTLAGGLAGYQETFPTYVRSVLPGSIREHISLGMLTGFFDVLVFLLRWVAVPGFLLPLTLRAADQGFHGLGRVGWKTWKITIASLHYWLILTSAAFLGVYGSNTLLGWRPSSESPTFAGETANLVLRTFLAYGLALFSWMVACSLIGRRAGSAQSVAGDSTP
jgi:hypothetical protein